MTRSSNPFIGRFLMLMLGLVFTACTSIRPIGNLAGSRCLATPENTQLGKLYASAQARHPGQSGFRILEYGPEALMARAAMVDSAEHTLDLQYYIYDPDKIGQFLTERILEAANRGVRVRLLLDDNNQADDRHLIVLAAHPNIEVRIFNPFHYRGQWMKIPQYLTDLDRVNRRMHNKVLVVDNQLAILGGRNIGDNYFGISEEDNFRDFDLLMAGPLVKETSTAFDVFWNSPWAIPAEALTKEPVLPAESEALSGSLERNVFGTEGSRERYIGLRNEYTREVIENPDHLVWAAGEVIWDSPTKMRVNSADTVRVARRLENEIDNCKQELMVECGYFVPGSEGVKQLASLAKKGVRILMITGALEATDQPLVYSAYRRYRKALLASGVELYEFKVQAKPMSLKPRRWFAPKGPPASLHSKAMVFDRQRIWIGSFNLDERSKRYNTEIAAIISSPELAEQLSRNILEDAAPERSWRVKLIRTNQQDTAATHARVLWAGERNGVPLETTVEPARSWWQRFRVKLYSLIPFVEKLL
jgi:cardiolipin synthase C